MTDLIGDTARRLNELLMDSEDYHKYLLYKSELDQYPEIKVRVNEFRKKNFEFRISGGPDAVAGVTRLEDEYRDLLNNSLVSSYLNAELSFCRTMQNITKEVYRGIEMELDFL